MWLWLEKFLGLKPDCCICDENDPACRASNCGLKNVPDKVERPSFSSRQDLRSAHNMDAEAKLTAVLAQEINAVLAQEVAIDSMYWPDVSLAPKYNPTEEEISAYAYELWEDAGKPKGESDNFWFEAEWELKYLGKNDNS